MNIFLKKHFKINFNETDIDFDKNDNNYIYYHEKDKKKGKRYDYFLSKNITNLSSHGSSCFKLYDLLKKMNIDYSNYKILDIGSGKGFSLTIFSLFNFNNISGVEISDEYKNICEKNFKLLNIEPKINIYKSDILNFNKINDFNMYYFYNPFNSIFFEKVIKKIKKNREIIIIYKNIHKEDIDILNKYNFNQIIEFEGCVRNYKIFLYKYNNE